MKLMIASDLHGSLPCCRRLLEAYKREQAERLLLLGDLLYHGPRNDLPEGYCPKKVADLLNENKNELLCVRGNCDAQVDQMVLEFPIMADSMLLYLDGHTVFATHGHIFNEQELPPLKKGDILLHGHTHVQALSSRGSYFYMNPGSVSIPKEGSRPGYLVYEDGIFILKELEGKEIRRAFPADYEG